MSSCLVNTFGLPNEIHYVKMPLEVRRSYLDLILTCKISDLDVDTFFTFN